jgi:hypothetical protein
MIRNSEDELYIAIKNKIGFDKSKKFKDWFHKEFPGMEQHHGCGSYTGIKTSDFFSMPVTRQQHELAEKDKSGFCIQNLPMFIVTMIKYIRFLESQLKGKK